VATGCTSDEPEKGPPEGTSAPTPAAAWEEGLSGEQIDVAHEALDWLNSFDNRNDDIFEQGRATSEAKEFFQDNLTAWTITWDSLVEAESTGSTVEKETGWIVESTPTSVEIFEGGARVTVTQCIDATKIRSFAGGEPVPQPAEPVTSYTRVTDVVRGQDGTWRKDPSNSDLDTPCDTSAG
jgi:hypothetical protein